MVVHPSPGHDSGTLVNAILFHCGLSTLTANASAAATPASLDGLRALQRSNACIVGAVEDSARAAHRSGVAAMAPAYSAHAGAAPAPATNGMLAEASCEQLESPLATSGTVSSQNATGARQQADPTSASLPATPDTGIRVPSGEVRKDDDGPNFEEDDDEPLAVQTAQGQEAVLRPGIVHRLDKGGLCAYFAAAMRAPVTDYTLSSATHSRSHAVESAIRTAQRYELDVAYAAHHIAKAHCDLLDTLEAAHTIMQACTQHHWVACRDYGADGHMPRRPRNCAPG